MQDTPQPTSPVPPSPPPPTPVPGTSTGAGQRVDDAKGRIFPCESCGADLAFNIGVQSLKCPFCGFVKELDRDEDRTVSEQDLDAILQRVARQRAERRKEESPAAGGDGEAMHEVRCESCGANVQFRGTLTSSECPYCTSPIQREGVHDSPERIAVDGILSFRVEAGAARVNLVKWVKSRWFLPSDLQQRGVSARFHGTYLPYWTYDTMTLNRYTGMRGEHYWVTVGSGKNKRREMRTRWYPASGRFQRFFDDVLSVGTRGVSEELLLELEPWPIQHCVPFNQEILAGYTARTYDIEIDEGFGNARTRIERAIEAEVRQRIGGDTQQIHSINTDYQALTYKHLLLPVWLLAYKYAQKTYQVTINAATGEVQGERPYSWIKITLAVLGALIVAGGIAYALYLGGAFE